MITKNTFGLLKDNQLVEQYTLSNKQGCEVDILTLGAIVRRFAVPTSSRPIDIVLGFDNLQGYIDDQSYLGAAVGRYANRINQGQFQLNGTSHQVITNLAGNCLHGGPDGFSHRVWQAEIVKDSPNPSLALTLVSEDGDQGFPGTLEVKVVYTLTEQNRLSMEYFATSDQDTIFNPTNHAYFNLAGHSSGSVIDHKIALQARRYTPINDTGIPTGELAPVQNTPFAFNDLTSIGQALGSKHPQIQYGNGLDHNFCLDNYTTPQQNAHYAAKAVCTASGLTMKVYTSMPGLQVFTANHFADMPGKNGAIYQAAHGICFESQFYPDSPNHSHFPSATLKTGESFYSVTEYQIEVE